MTTPFASRARVASTPRIGGGASMTSMKTTTTTTTTRAMPHAATAALTTTAARGALHRRSRDVSRSLGGARSRKTATTTTTRALDIDAIDAAAATDAARGALETVAQREAEASRAVWAALERAGEILASGAADFGAHTNVRDVITNALQRAFEALPDGQRAQFTSGWDAFYDALPPEASAAAAEAIQRVGDVSASGGAAFVAGIVAVVFTSKLFATSDDSSGMDEWAALASAEGDVEPAELRRYDPKATQKYFSTRPLTLLKRGIRSFALLGSFTVQLRIDRKLAGENMSDEAKMRLNTKRATQLRNLLVSLGPTYVKLGQVLSSRADLLPAEYIEELRVLQDKVPPFNDDLARRILTRELGESTAKRLTLGDTPIASASLGQVYKGTWLNDMGELEEVAVKVQRPGALVAISLDVGIIRAFAEPWRKFNNLNSDLEGLVDEWGRRFIAELDYNEEATNGEKFAAAMAKRSDLGGVVTAAPVFRQASTRRILTTGWIDGERLQDSKAGDTAQLCAVALTSYLAMLLDLGFLHADPHPGNLLRTTDGKLCILDWGLVTPVSKDLSTAILRFIAHLVSKDFEKVPADLDAMGFIPSGKREAMEDSGVARALGLLFSALARGGGAQGFRDELGLPDEERIKEIRKDLKGVKDPKKRRDAFLEAAGTDSKVAQLTKDLEGVQEKYGNIFQIPAYFGYILRAFSVLEGIGLSCDKNYSIANECYPYIARRLLTDKSPETRRALEQLLYGKEDGEHATLSVNRVRQLSKAFGSYTSITAARAGEPKVEKPDEEHGQKKKISNGAREALKLAFDPSGGPIQDIALRELGRYAGAFVSSAASSTIAAPFNAVESVAQSFAPAAELLSGAKSTLAPLERATHVSQEDIETLQVAEELRLMFSGGEQTAPNEEQKSAQTPGMPEIDAELVRELLDLAPELAPGAQAAALRLGSVLFGQAAYRVARATRPE